MPNQELACATDETKLWLSPFVTQHQNPCSRASPVYLDLSTCHDWPVKSAIVGRFADQILKGNLRCITGNLLSLWGAQYKDISVALQT